MQKPQIKEAPKGFGPQDILFVLFKHKWMILLLASAGLVAAAAVFHYQKPLYQSTAKLLVRYVMETGAVDPYSAMKSPGGGGRSGDPVILTEIEILKSADLARDVAQSVGLEKLLPGLGGIPAAEDQSKVVSGAAGVILSELEVSQGESPNVLHVKYGNVDEDAAKVVLDKLLELYFKKHLDIHRSAAAFDLVSKQTEEVRSRLLETEKNLNQLRTESGITSLSAATDALSGQRARTRDDLMKARAELAEQEARIQSLLKTPGREEGADPATNNQATASDDPLERVPPRIVTEFRAIMEMIGILQKRDLELRIKFTDGNRLVAQNQRQINDYESRRRTMIERFPVLTQESVAAATATGNAAYDLDMEKARLAAISAKIAVFNEHLKEIAVQFSEQYTLGAEIDAMERNRQMEEAEFRSLETKLKEARLDLTLDPKRMPNIEIIQQPTEPVKIFDELTKKIILGLAAGGLALGLGLAFLIELLFNRKIERSVEIRARLQLPLLLSIPHIRKKDRGGLMLPHEPDLPRIAQGSDANLLIARDQEAPEFGERKANHFILPYAETIRDRTIFNFEINNLTHKPKLLAVTGLSEGAGTSTIAAGLAKSFSDISGVKVLLVDLSSCRPEESPIFSEFQRHSLNGALQLATNTKFRESAQRLYYASATARRDNSGLTTFSPIHLYELMPQLQASDYDYIIFDMPPVDQNSRTLTMAGMMDKVLLVLDAENTSRDALLWGYSELVKGKADVSCVFNKSRSPVPGWLIGEN